MLLEGFFAVLHNCLHLLGSNLARAEIQEQEEPHQEEHQSWWRRRKSMLWELGESSTADDLCSCKGVATWPWQEMVIRLAISMPVGVSIFHTRVGFPVQFPVPTQNSSFLPMQWGDSGWCLKPFKFAIHMGAMDWVPSSCLWPGSVLAAADIWVMRDSVDGNSPSPFLSQLNQHFFFKCK